MSRRRGFLLAAMVLLVAAAVALFLMGRTKVEEFAGGGTRAPGLREDAPLRTIRLYFADPERFALRTESRTVAVGGTVEERLSACIDEMARGSLTGAAPVLPGGTRLQRIFLDPWGLAFLDFSRELLEVVDTGEGTEWLAVAAVVRTLGENFPEIREIRFMVDGHVVTSLGGYVDLEEPLSPEDFPVDGTLR